MAQQFSDAARTGLASAILAADTSFTVGSGVDFPVADTGAAAITDAGKWFKVVLQDASNFEIVYVRTHAAGSATFGDVLRAQEGTTAHDFGLDAVVGQRMTAANAAKWEEGGGVKYDFTQSADFTALANKAYWLAGSYTVTLPASAGLPLGTMVHFMKALAATPTIQAGTGSAVIQTSKGSDTSILFDVDAELVFVFNGADWEV